MSIKKFTSLLALLMLAGIACPASASDAGFTNLTVSNSLSVTNPANTYAPMVSFQKGPGSASSLDVLESDYTGDLARFVPMGYTRAIPGIYIDNGGGIYASTWLIMSNHRTGGNINFPSADPFMIGCWADVGDCIQARPNTSYDYAYSEVNAAGTAHVMAINNSGSYLFGNGARGSFDLSLSRDAAGVLDIGTGADKSTAGSAKMTNLTASGVIRFAGVTTGTNTDFVCMASGGVLTLQTSACTISSLRFKEHVRPFIGNALTKIEALEVDSFNMERTAEPNPDPNFGAMQIGLIAENIAKVLPACAIYENDMSTPKSYRQECVIAMLIKGEQELIAQNTELKARLLKVERRSGSVLH